MKYIFIDSNDLVVQVIDGNLDENEKNIFLLNYSSLFNAISFVEKNDDEKVFIGGKYINGEFFPVEQKELVE